RPADFIFPRLGRLLGFSGPWLDDREAGYYADPPETLDAAVTVVFVALAIGADRLLVLAFHGDMLWPLSLSVLGVIAAGVFEIGRPRMLRREEAEEERRTEEDFLAFAEERLERRGTVHISEVRTAFRQYNPRYRTAAGISDIAIERLARRWHAGEQRSGYMRGLSLRKDADIF
ncbi:unnamed protein product, partial [Phaeothamnion confervicola]